MTITSSGDYLRVALQTLQTRIMPEMQSSDGQAAAAILGRVLTELARRETVSAPELAASVAAGRQIEAKLTQYAQTRGLADAGLPGTPPDSAPPENAGFSALAGEHGALMSRLSMLAARLAQARPTPQTPAQPDDGQAELSGLLREMAGWAAAFPEWQRSAPLPAPPAPAEARGDPLSRDLLEAFLRSVHPDGDRVCVTQFAPIPGGFGKQTSRATYTDGAGAAHMVIVRKSDPLPMANKGAFRIDNEFALLRDVHRAGMLPVPEPLWLAQDFPGVDADFYLMAPLPGAVPSSFLGAASAQIPRRSSLRLPSRWPGCTRSGWSSWTTISRGMKIPRCARRRSASATGG